MVNPTELNALISSFLYIEKHAAIQSPAFEELRNNCEIFRQNAPQIQSYVGEYTFEGIEANGYNTYLKVLGKFAQLVETHLRSLVFSPADQQLNLASRCILNYYRQLEKFRERSRRDPLYDIFSTSGSNTPIFRSVSRASNRSLSPLPLEQHLALPLTSKSTRKRSLLAPPEYRKVEFFQYFR